MELDRGEDAPECEEEDWNDTRWAVPQNDTLSIKMPSDVGKSQTSEVTEVENEKRKKEDKKQDALMSRMEINDHKAGMEGLDREKINQVIFETSKGSKFFENERKKEEQVNKRVEEQKRKLDKLTDLQIQQGLVGIDKLLIDLEEGRDLNHSIVHVDMDAFYAAVEERDDPSLKDKPMAVGGLSMLSTSNYHARKFGVRAGMPGFIGKKLCPDLVMVETNFEKYTSVSHEIREVMAQYDSNFCPMSLDEAYLDFTKHMSDRKISSAPERTFYYRPDDSVCCCIAENLDFDFEEQYKITREDAHRLINMAEDQENTLVSAEKSRAAVKEESSGAKSESVTDTAGKTCSICGKVLPSIKSLRSREFSSSLVDAVNEMRFRVHQKTKLTASAGIAANSRLAKVCSDMNKPNGQFMVESTVEAVKEFIRELPIRKISGIGKVSEKMLSAIGIKTCSDLLAKRGILYHLYSTMSFNYFMKIALGLGSTKIVGEENYKRKSYSTERTFGEISQPAELFKKCLELCESLCESLKEENIKGRTVTLKIKTVKFLVKTKAQSLMTLTNDLEPIYSAARDLLRTEIQAMAPQPLKLRLMGVRLSNLVNLNESDHPKQGTITDIIKKMQSSPKKTQTNTSTQVSNCDVLDSDHVLLTLDFPCNSACSSDTPVSTTDSLVAQHSSSVLQLKANGPSESDLATNTVPCTSKELKESCTNVSDIQKKSSNSTSIKSTKKSVLDMLKAKATANISTHSVISEGESCAKSAETKESHLSSVDVLQTLQNSWHKRQEPDTTKVLPGTSKDCSGPTTQTVLAGTSTDEKPALSSIQSGATHTQDEDKDKSVKKSSEDHKEDHYECPICCKLLEGYSSHKISVHVDQCLALSEDNNNGGDNNTLHSNNIQNTQPNTDIAKSTSGDCVTPKRHTNTSATTTALGTQPSTSTMTNAMMLSTPKSSTKSGRTMRNSSSKASSSSAAKKKTKTPQRPSNPQRTQNDDDSALICPVCDLEQDTYDLVAFNKHVDSCLSKATIRQIVRQQDTETPNKRLNSNGQDKGGPPKKKIKVGTIESFFRK